MRNITLSIDDQAYHNARLWCAERDISVSRVVAIFLQDLPRIKTADAFLSPAHPNPDLWPPSSTIWTSRISPTSGTACVAMHPRAMKL